MSLSLAVSNKCMSGSVKGSVIKQVPRAGEKKSFCTVRWEVVAESNTYTLYCDLSTFVPTTCTTSSTVVAQRLTVVMVFVFLANFGTIKPATGFRVGLTVPTSPPPAMPLSIVTNLPYLSPVHYPITHSCISYNCWPSFHSFLSVNEPTLHQRAKSAEWVDKARWRNERKNFHAQLISQPRVFLFLILLSFHSFS